MAELFSVKAEYYKQHIVADEFHLQFLDRRNRTASELLQDRLRIPMPKNNHNLSLPQSAT